MDDPKLMTLCALQEEGFIRDKVEEFKRLIQPAHFFCLNCGRSAVSDASLCNPEKF